MRRYRFVSEFRDRHGNLRTRFRRGAVSVYLSSAVGSEGFEAEYNACLASPQIYREVATINADAPLTTQARAYLARQGLSADGGRLYFVRSAGRIKIGYTGSILKRFGSLTTNCPDRITLIAIVPGTQADEKAWHDRFAADRIVGEWFKPTLELRLAITAIKRRTLSTRPDRVRHQFAESALNAER